MELNNRNVPFNNKYTNKEHEDVLLRPTINASKDSYLKASNKKNKSDKFSKTEVLDLDYLEDTATIPSVPLKKFIKSKKEKSKTNKNIFKKDDIVILDVSKEQEEKTKEAIKERKIILSKMRQLDKREHKIENRIKQVEKKKEKLEDKMTLVASAKNRFDKKKKEALEIKINKYEEEIINCERLITFSMHEKEKLNDAITNITIKKPKINKIIKDNTKKLKEAKKTNDVSIIEKLIDKTKKSFNDYKLKRVEYLKRKEKERLLFLSRKKEKTMPKEEIIIFDENIEKEEKKLKEELLKQEKIKAREEKKKKEELLNQEKNRLIEEKELKKELERQEREKKLEEKRKQEELLNQEKNRLIEEKKLKEELLRQEKERKLQEKNAKEEEAKRLREEKIRLKEEEKFKKEEKERQEKEEKRREIELNKQRIKEEEILKNKEKLLSNKKTKEEIKLQKDREREEKLLKKEEINKQKELERQERIKEKVEKELEEQKEKEAKRLNLIEERREKRKKLEKEKEEARKERREKAKLIKKAEEESKLKERENKKTFEEKIKNWYNNLSFIKDQQNRRELKRQTLLIDFEGADAVRSEEKIMYKYVAKNNETGKIEKGLFAAYSKLDVHSFLLAEGYEVYEIVPQKEFKFKFKFLEPKFKPTELDFFLTQLSTFLKSGITLVDSVKILSKQSKKKNHQQVYKSIIYELSMGENFSAALEKQGSIFPRLLVNMVKTSELTGDLPETLDDMADYYRETEKTRKQMVSAITYPAVVLVFALGILMFIMIGVIPQFVDIYGDLGTELPRITVVIIGISDFLKTNWLYLLIGLLAFILVFTLLYKSIKVFKTVIQSMLMHLPIFGNIIIYNEVTMFTKTFASLLNHNVYITDCMEVLSKITNNEIYKMLIFDTITNLAKGEAISNSFKNQWAFPNIAYEMILTGEKTGQLGNMMDKVAEFYQEQHKNAVNQIKAFIEPVMIVVLAVIVGVVLLSVILPMFDMYENIDM